MVEQPQDLFVVPQGFRLVITDVVVTVTVGTGPLVRQFVFADGIVVALIQTAERTHHRKYISGIEESIPFFVEIAKRRAS